MASTQPAQNCRSVSQLRLFDETLTHSFGDLQDHGQNGRHKSAIAVLLSF